MGEEDEEAEKQDGGKRLDFLFGRRPEFSEASLLALPLRIREHVSVLSHDHSLSSFDQEISWVSLAFVLRYLFPLAPMTPLGP